MTDLGMMTGKAALRLAKEESGLTRDEIAERLGVSHSVTKRYFNINDTYMPSLEMIPRLCLALGNDILMRWLEARLQGGESFSPPLPPTVWGELSLCFDVDFPIDTVSSILGVQPTEAKRQRACRWNAYAGTQNPGYWTITFDKTDTFDGDVVQRAMHTFIAEHERALRQVLEQFQPCTALLTIYAVVHQDGEYPSIRLNPYFLQDACRLSASVDIIVDNDYVRAEPDNGDSAV